MSLSEMGGGRAGMRRLRWVAFGPHCAGCGWFCDGLRACPCHAPAAQWLGSVSHMGCSVPLRLNLVCPTQSANI